MSSIKAANSESVYPYLSFNPKAASVKTAENSRSFNQPILVLYLTHGEDPFFDYNQESSEATVPFQ